MSTEHITCLICGASIEDELENRVRHDKWHEWLDRLQKIAQTPNASSETEAIGS